ncbi:MAG TPA: polysaccharide deacetylase family protein [Polyangia bacterium]|nr:polysaccharide deacetylase family protein [Polyangia bacterium]
MSKREQAAHLLAKTGLGRLLSWLGRWEGLLVMNYHRIGDSRGTEDDEALFSATAEAFDSQLQSLAANCDVIGSEDLDLVLAGGRRGRFVHITFDDGYRDNFTLALPLLRARGLGATFFVTTDFIDQRGGAWWDEIAWMARHSARPVIEPNDFFSEPVRLGPGANTLLMAIHFLLGVYKRMKAADTERFVDFLAEATGAGRRPTGTHESTWMTWKMLREAASAGIGIGGHTVTHPVLTRLPPEQQVWQIEQCRSRIEQEVGRPMRLFSYPTGGRGSFDDHTRASLARNDVRYAFSYYGGYQSTRRWDRFDIRRVAVEAALDPHSFESLFRLPQLFAS